MKKRLDDYLQQLLMATTFTDMCMWKTAGADNNIYRKRNGKARIPRRILMLISPAAYNNVEGLNLEPGTYISIIGKDDSSSYWTNVTHRC